MEIIVKNSKFNIPDRYKLSVRKRFLRYKTPNCAVFEELRENGKVNVEKWPKKKGNEPFVPENHVDIDGVLFRAVHIG